MAIKVRKIENGEVTQEGTKITDEVLASIVYKDDKSIEFQRVEGTILPEPEVGVTKIATTAVGDTYVITTEKKIKLGESASDSPVKSVLETNGTIKSGLKLRNGVLSIGYAEDDQHGVVQIQEGTGLQIKSGVLSLQKGTANKTLGTVRPMLNDEVGGYTWSTGIGVNEGRLYLKYAKIITDGINIAADSRGVIGVPKGFDEESSWVGTSRADCLNINNGLLSVSMATQTRSGAMSKADKIKLDNLATKAVTSVNGRTGAVSITANEIGAQATLVSGSNIKTINAQSIIGNGNIEIQGKSDDWVTVYTTSILPNIGGNTILPLEYFLSESVGFAYRGDSMRAVVALNCSFQIIDYVSVVLDYTIDDYNESLIIEQDHKNNLWKVLIYNRSTCTKVKQVTIPAYAGYINFKTAANIHRNICQWKVGRCE